MRVGIKLVLSFLLVVLVPMGILAVVTTNIVNSRMDESARETINQNLMASWIQYYVRANQMKFGMLQAAAEPWVAEAFAEGDGEVLKELMDAWKPHRPYVDVWAVTDANGIVIARLNTDHRGDHLGLNGAVTKALRTQAPVVTTEVLGVDVLSKEGFSVDSEEMMLTVITPVLYNGDAVGTIITGDILNYDSFVPDTLGEKIPGLIVSIAQGDVVISTNIEEDGARATGATLEGAIMEKVTSGASFYGEASIGAREYKVAAEPIINNAGEIVGALFVGVPKERFIVLKNENIRAIATVTLLGILISGLLAASMATRISRPIRELAKNARRIAGGDFSVRVDVSSADEIGELASSFSTMATELKESYEGLEHKIDDRTKELNSIMNSTGDGLMVLDRDRRIVYFNNTMERITGKKASETIGKPCREVIEMHPELCRENCPHPETIEESKSHSNEVQFTDPKTGEERYFIITASPIFDENGEVMAVVETLKDITERKMLEQQLEKYSKGLEREAEERAKELATSEEKYRTLIETMNEGVAVVDVEGTLVFVNEKFEEILEYDRGEMIDKSIFSLFDEENREKLRGELEKRSKGESSVYEVNAITKIGKLRTLMISGTPLFDDEGDFKGSFGVITDITEKKRLEQQILQAEKLASVGELAAGVAHEINNPLANISVYANLIKDEIKSGNAPDLEDVEVIVEQVQKGSNIVRDLLDFSRQYEPHVSPIDVNEIIEDALKLLERRLALGNIKVTKKMDPKVSRTRGDANKLQQVFFNLIRNAQEAMPKGGEVSITTSKEDNMIEAVISDTGVGIPGEHLTKIFDPFFTTKKIGEGTGLGLSISHGIIREHGGTIEVSSVGTGSTFIVRLPGGAA